MAADSGGLDLVPVFRRACLGHESFRRRHRPLFPVALVCSWAFEITPEGIKRESDIDPGKSGTGEPVEESLA